jgi:pimeloyl-ACP methyl ester carboxylesterase
MLDETELYERVMCGFVLTLGARSRWVTAEAGRVHVIDVEGRGPLPPLVLLHGYSASGASQFWAMVRRLRKHVSRILLPDLLGHGLSSVPAHLDGDQMQEGLDDALDALLSGPAVVFASSLSGAFAIRYAIARPERVRGLMLCSPGGAPIAAAEHGELTRMFRVADHRAALAFVDRLFAVPHPLRHLYAWGVRRQFNRSHLLALLDRVADARFLAPEELTQLKMPVHLVWGAADRILPHSHFDYFRQHLPPGTVIDTPVGFGHAPFIDQTDPLCERLVHFCERLRWQPNGGRSNGHEPNGHESSGGSRPR